MKKHRGPMGIFEDDEDDDDNDDDDDDDADDDSSAPIKSAKLFSQGRFFPTQLKKPLVVIQGLFVPECALATHLER